MLVGVLATFCAGHKMPQHEHVHGHSYEVWAYADSGDVEKLQLDLSLVCSELDHRMLNDVIGEPTMENIAVFLSVRLAWAVRIKVIRPVEGLCCEWTKYE